MVKLLNFVIQGEIFSHYRNTIFNLAVITGILKVKTKLIS